MTKSFPLHVRSKYVNWNDKNLAKPNKWANHHPLLWQKGGSLQSNIYVYV
jgi:hypothetical protein